MSQFHIRISILLEVGYKILKGVTNKEVLHHFNIFQQEKYKIS